MENKIKKAAKNLCGNWGMEDGHGYSVKDTYQVGFIQGANYALENQWHDLRKNPNDLPPMDDEINYKASEYVLLNVEGYLHSPLAESYSTIGFYDNGDWLVVNGDIIEERVIAWMPIPKFNNK